MGKDSNIQWTHHTFNPWRGCTKVSEGCKFCYADTLSKRNPGTLGVWGPNGSRVVASESYWRQPIAWNKAAKTAGEVHRVFCASLADVGEGPETMPAGAWLDVQMARTRLSKLIVESDGLHFLLLTKRPENMTRFYDPMVLERAWVGTSVENGDVVARVDALRQVPAAVRFLSCEPQIGPLSLNLTEIDWVIVGGESGGKARPFNPNWARDIIVQCRAVGAAVFIKQMGANPIGLNLRDSHGGDMDEWPEDLRVREFPTVLTV